MYTFTFSNKKYFEGLARTTNFTPSMKRVLTFFGLVFFHFAGIQVYAYASAQNGMSRHSAESHTGKNQQLDILTTSPDCLITTDDGTGLIVDHIFNVEDDDDDTFNKHIAPVRYLLAFYYAFISPDRCSIAALRLPYNKHLSYLGSCKYISQRVLRI